MIVIRWRQPIGTRCGSRRTVHRTTFGAVAKAVFRAKHFN